MVVKPRTERQKPIHEAGEFITVALCILLQVYPHDDYRFVNVDIRATDRPYVDDVHTVPLLVRLSTLINPICLTCRMIGSWITDQPGFSWFACDR